MPKLDPQRYEPTIEQISGGYHGVMERDSHGGYVKWQDYLDLCQEITSVRKKLTSVLWELEELE